MARVKNAVAREGIPIEEQASSTLSAAADIPRKTLAKTPMNRWAI
jgi:hypothetical protein